MEQWVHRALEKWPNVPALFGWLGLDRRGRWLIKGETISRPQIIDTINRNYAADEHGRWYFQNGPQRGYVALACAPLILRIDGGGHLMTHTGRVVAQVSTAFLDASGALLLATEHGPGMLDDQDLGWALERLHAGDQPVTEDELTAALASLPPKSTGLYLHLGTSRVPVQRLDLADAPHTLSYVLEPQPREGERVAGPAPP